MALQEGSPPQLPSENIFWDILESVTDAVVTIDEDHRVLICNKAAEEMFGYRRDEIVGEDVSPLIPDPHQSLHREYVEHYLDTGIARVIGRARECYGRRKNGESFPVEISYSVSRTRDRMYFTAVIRDISSRKAKERENRFMERLADVGKAVAQVVHEIRKPLMLIGGFARQVEQCPSLASSEKERKKLGIIADEVARLEKLLNGIRLLTRPAAVSQKSPLAINHLLRETFDLLEPMLQDQQVELEIELDRDPLLTQGDPDQLKQVFLNLLQNALDALSGAGTISVTSKMQGFMAQVRISDDGPGIPPELHEKLFDPFFTTKAQGTGLGLAISRNIIRDHGGNLSFQSEPDQGTTFIIEMPLKDVP